jgi:mRNA-degrading endonuclease RelE of RelBE toxin-antitoxin system
VTAPFRIRTTPRFERLARALGRAHPEFPTVLTRALPVLAADPHNRTGTHRIRKLEGTPAGEGQWRLALGRFRIRYDVQDRDVVLHYCGLRRENTYR